MKELLHTISLEVISQLFRQTRLLLLGTHIQLLQLDGKAAQIFPARKQLRTRGLTPSAVMQVHLEVLHVHNMAPRGGLQQDLRHHPHMHRPHMVRPYTHHPLHTHPHHTHPRHTHSHRMHHLDMRNLRTQTTHHT